MVFSNIHTLLNHLTKTHRPDQHLYRGQMKRYEPHRWKFGDQFHEVETLYPGDYRFIYKHSEPSEELARLVSSARSYGREVREQFITVLILYLKRSGMDGAWADEMVNSFLKISEGAMPHGTLFFQTAWSLAQHYLIATALLDLTFDPLVAAWFATNPWNPDELGPKPGQQGVLYRFDREKIEALLALRTQWTCARAEHDGEFPPPPLFLIDIRSIPESFAKRPRAQQGASLYGFDQIDIISSAFRIGAIKPFVFTHEKTQDIGLIRDDVIPEEDDFLYFIKRFKEIRGTLSPETSVINQPQKTVENVGPLERVTTILKLTISGGRQRDKIVLSSNFTAYLFDQMTSYGRIKYKYLLVAIDSSSGAIGCVLAVEQSSFLDSAKLPDNAKSLGLGNEILGLWDGGGRKVMDMGKWSNFMQFREEALPLARSVLGLLPAQ